MPRALVLLVWLCGCSAPLEGPHAAAPLQPGSQCGADAPPMTCSPRACPEVICGQPPGETGGEGEGEGEGPTGPCACDETEQCDRNFADDGMCLCDPQCRPTRMTSFCEAEESSCQHSAQVCDPDTGRFELVTEVRHCAWPDPISACPPPVRDLNTPMGQGCTPTDCPARSCSAAAAEIASGLGATVVGFDCAAAADGCSATLTTCDPGTGEQRLHSVAQSCQNCALVPEPPACAVQSPGCVHDCMGTVLAQVREGHVISGWGCLGGPTATSCQALVTQCDPATGALETFRDQMFCEPR